MFWLCPLTNIHTVNAYNWDVSDRMPFPKLTQINNKTLFIKEEFPPISGFLAWDTNIYLFAFGILEE